MSLCPPLDMLHLSGEPSQTQPRSPEYWVETLCSPVTTEARKTLNETGVEKAIICVC